MAKLFFNYSTMNAGKTTALLQAAHNNTERGMHPYLLTADFDDRDSESGVITSRIGIEKSADTYNSDTDMLKKIQCVHEGSSIDCVFIEEAQWLTSDQVWQLTDVVDRLGIPVMCYGLRLDFRSELFPGSAALLGLADEMREIRTICHCGRKAICVVRRDENGKALRGGPQVLVGGNETYESLCRRHWKEEVSD